MERHQAVFSQAQGGDGSEVIVNFG
jgi:hypothetical protein